MKIKSIIFLVFSIVFFAVSSCKKKKTDTPSGAAQEGFPISSAFTNSNYLSVVTSSGAFEHGCRFAVTKAGKILGFGCKMPAAGSYRVTLWSYASQSVISQVTITQESPQSQAIGAGLSISVAPGIDYLITVFSTSQWNEIRKVGGGNIPYPLTQGSVIIKGFQWIAAPTALPVLFPTNVANDYVAGISDIIFQPN